ncbi:MAG: hypothetical protein J4400_03960 [Candidatus Aenigmarchaeota archaeon]|nr:hypothetical protein [Candidatus Aenigmarchaeota archaeon]
MFEFLSSLDTTTAFLLLVIFILFVFSMKKVFSVIMNLVVIGAVSLIFPVVMNRFFGFDIPIDSDSLLSFVLLGVSVYFIYLVGKSLYKVLGIAERATKKYMPDRKEKAKKEEPRDDGNDRNDRDDRKYKGMEKELKEREKELAKKEQELRWKSSIQKAGKKKDWTKDYAALEHTRESKEMKKKDGNIDVSRNPITPLPVIEYKGHKPKKKRKK